MPSSRHSHRRRSHPATLLLALALVWIAGASFPSTIVAAPADPVVAAINRATAQQSITPAQAGELRLDWARSARAARTAPTASRRAAIAAVRAYTLALARRPNGLTADRLRPALLSVRATTTVMQGRGPFPSHEQEVEVPGEVVVFTYYSGRGLQFQPFETFKQGLRELNQKTPDVVAARAIADRMLELSARRGASITWEYFFPFGGPSTPWTSAISQAIATELLYRVGDAVGEPDRARYHAAADDVARSFVRGTGVGGVGVPEGAGRFYVMYSFHPSQRILNGHLQVLINLNRYAAATGSPVARRVVDQGIAAILPMLPRFDTGAWSNYQPGQEADLGYHEFQAGQLVKLGEETGNAELASYGARFTGYLVTPPTVLFSGGPYLAIFPAADRFRDTITVPMNIDKRSRITLLVRDSEGREITRTSTWAGRGARSITWDGRTASGARAPAGEYTGRLTLTDIAGNRAFVDLPHPLRVVADTTQPTLRLLTLVERGGTSVLTASAFDMASGWIDARLRIDGRIVATARGPRSGTVTLRAKRPLADVRRGELLLRDTSGNELVFPLAGS